MKQRFSKGLVALLVAALLLPLLATSVRADVPAEVTAARQLDNLAQASGAGAIAINRWQHDSHQYDMLLDGDPTTAWAAWGGGGGGGIAPPWAEEFAEEHDLDVPWSSPDNAEGPRWDIHRPIWFGADLGADVAFNTVVVAEGREGVNPIRAGQEGGNANISIYDWVIQVAPASAFPQGLYPLNEDAATNLMDDWRLHDDVWTTVAEGNGVGYYGIAIQFDTVEARFVRMRSTTGVLANVPHVQTFEVYNDPALAPPEVTPDLPEGGNNVLRFLADTVNYTLNGETRTSANPTFVTDAGRTMVPLRNVAEAFGGTPSWDETTLTAVISRPGQDDLRMQAGVDLGDGMYAMNEGGSIFVPLRFVADAFGAEVDWDPAARAAYVYW